MEFSIHGKLKPLYGTISQDGGGFALTYHYEVKDGKVNATNISRSGYDLSVFRGCPKSLPIIDFRPSNSTEVIKVIMAVDGILERDGPPSQWSDRINIEQYLDLMKRAGAIISPLKEVTG